MMKKSILWVVLAGMALAGCGQSEHAKVATTEDVANFQAELAKMKGQSAAAAGGAAAVPEGVVMEVKTADLTTIPDDELGKSIKDGLDIVQHTYKRLPDNVGNRLNCTSCHLGNGSTPYASPWNGVPGVFPQYRPRSGAVNTIEDRINGCFTRSLNGKALSKDSQEMKNIVAYMQWLSTGIPAGESPKGRGFVKINKDLVPNRENGKAIFAQKCASCHGEQGLGNYNPDGTYTFPAVAGKDSFNDGAGMARTYTAAAFIKGNMPFGQPNSLSDQEAIDVADYVAFMDRPVKANKDNDYPKGGAPKDVRK